jgi:hypothetical protein
MTQSDFNTAFQQQVSGQLEPPPHDPRYITSQILRRDQRRTRILAALSLLFWLIGAAGMLLMVAGLNRFVGLMRIGDFPWNNHNAIGWSVPLEDQVSWGTDLLHHSIPFIECSIVSLMLAAFFTVWLIFSSRQATLNRINISLMEMSRQLRSPREPVAAPEGLIPPPAMWMEPRQPRLILAACLITLLACGITIATVACHTIFLSTVNSWQGYPMLSPFEAVRWNGEVPQVQVAGKWYELLEINNIPVKQITDFSRSMGSTTWQKHFEEDLVELLTKMGHTPGMSATLLVKDLDSQKEVTLTDIPMTGANRWALWSARQKAERFQDRSPQTAP